MLSSIGMAVAGVSEIGSPVIHPDRFFIDGEWAKPSTDATFEILDSNDEPLFFRVAEAREPDMERAVSAARIAFDSGPWPLLTHRQRAEYLRSLAQALEAREAVLTDIWPRESGVTISYARGSGTRGAGILRFYASLADSF